jgi:hypothetical protein
MMMISRSEEGFIRCFYHCVEYMLMPADNEKGLTAERR